MQDKTIDNALRYLHRECMNGRAEGLVQVVELMRIRGVEPSFKAKHAKMGYRKGRGSSEIENKKRKVTFPAH